MRLITVHDWATGQPFTVNKRNVCAFGTDFIWSQPKHGVATELVEHTYIEFVGGEVSYIQETEAEFRALMLGVATV